MTDCSIDLANKLANANYELGEFDAKLTRHEFENNWDLRMERNDLLLKIKRLSNSLRESMCE